VGILSRNADEKRGSGSLASQVSDACQTNNGISRRSFSFKERSPARSCPAVLQGGAGPRCKARFSLEDLSRVRGVSSQDWRKMTIGPTSTGKALKALTKVQDGKLCRMPFGTPWVLFGSFRMCGG
jgi:hypothetical protein